MLHKGRRAAAGNGGGPPAWTPADLGADLVGWYDASDSGTLTLSGSEVTQWDDKSGGGYDLSQGTSARRPIYGATSFNSSYPGLTFNTSSLATGVGAFAGFNTITSFSVFFVCTVTSGIAGGGRLISLSRNNDFDYTDARDFMIYWSGGTYTITTYRAAGLSSISMSADNPSAVGSICDGVNNTMYIDNSAGSPVGVTATVGDGSDTLRIGEAVMLSSEYWKGVISEVVLVKKALDSTERSDLQSYFAAKWGL
jgi:hypothetical protein